MTDAPRPTGVQTAAPGHPGFPGDDLSTNTANSLIHLYRGEVNRMTAYRVRLDTSTNWAIITTAGLLGYAFGPAGSHEIMLGAMLMNYFFLHVEARRFRLFEIAHLRVRLLEKFFYPTVLNEPVDPSWKQFMIRELEKPHLPLDRLEAIGWRLRHNYLWLYVALLIAWLAKLDASRPVALNDLASFVRAASIESLPGWIVFTAVTVFYTALVLLAVRARSYPLEMD